MKFFIDDKVIEGEKVLYSTQGLWTENDSMLEFIVPYVDVYAFKEKAEDQLLKHPDYLDLNEILKPS